MAIILSIIWTPDPNILFPGIFVLLSRTSKKICSSLGMVGHACNHRHSGDRDREDWVQPRQKAREIPISTNKLGMVVHTHNPSYMGDVSRRITNQTRQKHKILSKK
jgi:hypothetical protein